MKRTAIIAAMLLAAASGSLRAQTHTAQNDSMVARGWTFIATFDSIQGNATTFGDTIFVFGINLHKADSGRKIALSSVDGGESFDTLHLPGSPLATDPFDWFYNRVEFLGQVATIFLPEDFLDRDSIAISTDLGKTFTIYAPVLPKGTHYLTHDPFDPGTLYATWDSICGSHCNIEYLYQSKDTGKTWTRLTNAPIPYSLFYYNIRFNARIHGTWYLEAYSVSGMGTDDAVFRTTDNGESFEYWGNVLVDYGIGCPDEERIGWAPDSSEGGFRGFMTWGCGDSAVVHDWVDTLLPGRPDTTHAFYGNDFGGYEFFFSQIDPDIQLMEVSQSYYDSVLHSKFPDMMFWFFTVDDGATWKNIYQDNIYYYPLWLNMHDPREVWASSETYPFPPTWSIYRRNASSFNSEVQPAQGNPERWELLASGRPGNVSLTYSSAEPIRISLVDVLGREVAAYPRELDPGVSRVINWHVPADLAQGVYYIVARGSSNNVFKVVPVAIE
jgi:hypothetical protein